ncbi:hypothetical protein Gotur_033672 [Gossypium turneri]
MNSFYFACLYACYFGFAGILCCECKGYKKTFDTSVISISLDNSDRCCSLEQLYRP